MYEREAIFNAWIASFSPFPSYHLEGRQGCSQDWLDSRTGTTHHTVFTSRQGATDLRKAGHACVFSLFNIFCGEVGNRFRV